MTDAEKKWLTSEFDRLHEKFDYVKVVSKRVRILEQGKWKSIGAAAAIGSFIGFVFTAIGIYLKVKS